jgi:hypothetical protein
VFVEVLDEEDGPLPGANGIALGQLAHPGGKAEEDRGIDPVGKTQPTEEQQPLG